MVDFTLLNPPTGTANLAKTAYLSIVRSPLGEAAAPESRNREIPARSSATGAVRGRGGLLGGHRLTFGVGGRGPPPFLLRTQPRHRVRPQALIAVVVRQLCPR